MKEILITSSVLILALMLLRLAFAKKVRRTLIYGAWILVALRLLIPVQIGQLDFSVLSAAKPLTDTVTEIGEVRVVGQSAQDAHKQVIGEYIEKDQTVFTPEVQEHILSAIEEEMPREEIAEMIDKVYSEQEIFVPEVQQQVTQQVEERTNFVSVAQLAAVIWLAGVAVMGLWFLAANLHHRFLLRRERKRLDADSPIPVYASEKVSSPCLMGTFRPAVYVTPQCGENPQMMAHVLKHELTHYRHGDHIWSLVRCACLCVYWFDPLVWVAAYLSRRDCELACDEGAMNGLGEAERLAYGKTLLEVVSHAAGPGQLLQTATSMNETKRQLKERINFIVKKPKISITAAICMVLICVMIAGCVAAGPTGGQQDTNDDPPTTTLAPIEESYEYTTVKDLYLWPSLVDPWVERTALTVTTEDGTFFCMTEDTAKADDFIVAQRTLLRYLQEKGVDTGALEYYATDYDDSFSESDEGAAYIAPSAVGTWRQIMVTLQALWGDYIDYGYVYMLSNAIAGEMGWETESVPTVDEAALAAFFAENPDAIHLLYPSFVVAYASQETVDCCKALAARLLAQMDWSAALATPIGAQLDAWNGQISAYAASISVPFTRQSVGYAYHSQRVPLRMKLTYAEMFVEDCFVDPGVERYGNDFTDYVAIYDTANTIQQETAAAVAYFQLEDKVDLVQIKWISSDAAAGRYCSSPRGTYKAAADTIYLRTAFIYAHLYYRHLFCAYEPENQFNTSWQSSAFCELGTSRSRYGIGMWDSLFMQDEQWGGLYAEMMGKPYSPGREAFYNVMDLLCYVNDYYRLKGNGAESLDSFTRYLAGLYGEDVVCNMFLYPDTVEKVTGKTWDALQAEWEQFIRNKYAHVEIPDWVNG